MIVPPEGVIAIISVKKKFGQNDFKNETEALKNAAKLCRYSTESGEKLEDLFGHGSYAFHRKSTDFYSRVGI